MVLKYVLPCTAAIILDFTKPPRIHICQRADGIWQKLASYRTLNFTKPQRVHNCPRADAIKKLACHRSNYRKLHKAPTSSQSPPRLHKASMNLQLPKSGWYLKKLASYRSNYHRLHKPPTSSHLSQSGWYLKESSPSTAAATLDSTILQRIHNFLRVEALHKSLLEVPQEDPGGSIRKPLGHLL